jgi:hypothetical protein
VGRAPPTARQPDMRKHEQLATISSKRLRRSGASVRCSFLLQFKQVLELCREQEVNRFGAFDKRRGRRGLWARLRQRDRARGGKIVPISQAAGSILRGCRWRSWFRSSSAAEICTRGNGIEQLVVTAPPPTEPQVPVWARAVFHPSTSRSESATLQQAKAIPFSLRRRSFSNSGFSESVPVKLTSHSAQLPVRQA